MPPPPSRTEQRFTWMLITLILFFVGTPLIDQWLGATRNGWLLIQLLLFVIVINAVLLSVGRNALLYAGIALGSLALLLSITYVITGNGGLRIANHLLLCCVLLIALYEVTLHLFSKHTVTAHTLSAALTVYWLMAVLWSLLYLVCAALDPSSFHVPESERNFDGSLASETLYFSIVTLTTLGYGDITPVSGVTRMLAALEALVGQVFLAVIVARLVGLHASRTHAQSLPPPQEN
ncbi:MAG: potassium channel family protein [Opitutales bacterium]